MVAAVCALVSADQDQAQHKGIRVVVPSPGRYVGTGFVGFAPGSAASTESIRILRAGPARDEAPSTVRAAASWFDGSIKLAEIAFSVAAGQEGALYFWVEWGPDVRRTSVRGPLATDPLETLYFEEAEAPSPEFDLKAGSMAVRVERHPDLWYYAYLVPVAAIVLVLVWRKVKLSR